MCPACGTPSYAIWFCDEFISIRGSDDDPAVAITHSVIHAAQCYPCCDESCGSGPRQGKGVYPCLENSVSVLSCLNEWAPLRDIGVQSCANPLCELVLTVYPGHHLGSFSWEFHGGDVHQEHLIWPRQMFESISQRCHSPPETPEPHGPCCRWCTHGSGSVSNGNFH